jgi:serine/threonine-protein kinase
MRMTLGPNAGTVQQPSSPAATILVSPAHAPSAAPPTDAPARVAAPRPAPSQPSDLARTMPARSARRPASLAPPGEDPYVGQTLNGRFLVETKLGEGGFGAVYRATQVATGRKLAVKLLHPEMTRDDNVVARFRREGQVLCSLRDAHTITTYDFDQTPDGTLFIAMELLEGRSLHDVLHDEAPIAWTRMLKIVSEVCSALHEAHGQGIVHRDLKPENVYLEHRPGNPEFVKVLDFGIAKVVRGDGMSGFAGGPQLTATGQTLGTLEYMSPEQLMGKPLDGRSDIYGLGVVTFELLTGRLPFPDAVGPAALISAQLKKIPPRVSQACASAAIPPEVDGLVGRMLEKDKDRRFKDVGELRVACEQVLAGSQAFATVPAPSAHAVARGGTPVPAPTVARAGTPVPAPSPADARAQTPAPAPGSEAASTAEAIAASRRAGRFWAWMIVAFVLVVGGLLGAILALR